MSHNQQNGRGSSDVEELQWLVVQSLVLIHRNLLCNTDWTKLIIIIIGIWPNAET